MRWRAFVLILAVSLCDAAPRCSDPGLRHAKIRGETIGGYVCLRHPLCDVFLGSSVEVVAQLVV